MRPARATGMLGRAASGTLWLGVVNAVSKGSQAIVILSLAAFLTEADLGRVTVAIVLVNVAQTLQSMGTFDVVSRTSRDPARMASVVLTLNLALSIVATLALLVGADVLAATLGSPESAPQIRIAALGLPFVAVSGVQVALLHRTLDFRRRFWPDAGSALAGSTVTVVLAAVGAGAYSLAVGVLVTFCVQPLLWSAVGVVVRPGWDRAYAVEAVHWIRVVGVGAIVAIVIVNVDYAVVSRVLGEEALGVYSLAFRIAWVPYIAGAVVLGAVAFPVYSQLLREGTRIEAAAAGFLAATVLVVGGAYTIIAVMADRVVILGQRWEPSAPVLAILCGYGFLLSVTLLGYEALRAAGRSGVFLALQAWHLVSLTGLLLVLTPDGVRSAALAQVLAVVAVVVPTMVLARLAGAAPRWVTLLRPVLAGALGLVVVVVVDRAFDTWLFASTTGAAAIAATLLEGVVLAVCWAGAVVVVDRPSISRLRSLRG